MVTSLNRKLVCERETEYEKLRNVIPGRVMDQEIESKTPKFGGGGEIDGRTDRLVERGERDGDMRRDTEKS